MLPKRFSLLLIFSIILTLGLSISLGSLLAAWTSPASTPPDSNIASPINTSTTGQSKQGGLILNTGGSTNGLIVQSGNVGIGTDNPQAKLEVNGNIIASDPTANNHLATKSYVDALGGSENGEYVQGNATYFTAGGNNYYCSQRVVSSTGVVTISNVNEGQPCSTGKLCNAGNCSLAGAPSTACTIASQCASGFCVDGYCCDTACAGACQACNVSGSTGACTSVPPDTDPANECSSITCTSYIYGGTSPACYKYLGATAKNGLCNGSGACYAVADACSSQGTASITCGSAGCWNACAANSPSSSYDNYNEVCYTDNTTHGCVGNLTCDATGTCKLQTGAGCTADNQCGSGYLCGVDSDGDRYLTSATTGTCVLGTAHTDCYDANANVHPGQTSFFATHRGDGSFDYNCNWSDDKYDNTCLSCTSSVSGSCSICPSAPYSTWSCSCTLNSASCGNSFQKQSCSMTSVNSSCQYQYHDTLVGNYNTSYSGCTGGVWPGYSFAASTSGTQSTCTCN